jgi:hypothetical protein
MHVCTPVPKKAMKKKLDGKKDSTIKKKEHKSLGKIIWVRSG